MNRSRQFTQPFTVNISEVDEVTITSTKNKQITWSGDYSAELIGALGSKNTLDSLDQVWGNSNYRTSYTDYKDIAADGWQEVLSFNGFANEKTISTNGRYENGVPGDGAFTFIRDLYLLMRYPVQAIQDAKDAGVDMVVDGITVPNTVTYTLNGADGGTITGNASLNRSIKLTPYGGDSLFNKSLPSGVAMSQNSNRFAGNRLVIGKDAPLTLITNSDSFQLTADVKSPVAPTQSNGQADVPYTYTMEDGMECYISTYPGQWSTAKTLGNLVDPVRLADGDYSFNYVRLSFQDYNAQSLSGSWTADTEAVSDYTGRTGDNVVVYVRSAGGSFYPYAKIVKAAGVYTAYDYATGASLGDVTSANLALPAGTAGIKLEHTTDFFESKLTARVQMTLHPTETVRGYMEKLYDAHKNGYFTNLATMTLDQGGNSRTYTLYDTYQYTRSIHLNFVWPTSDVQKSSNDVTKVVNDKENSKEKQHVVIRTGNIPYNSGQKAEDVPMLQDAGLLIDTGTFYDLLPQGTTVDVSSVKVYARELAAGGNSLPITVTVDNNWQGTGRTMLIVSFDTPNRDLHVRDRALEYDLVNTYLNIDALGTDVLNTVAFVNTTIGGKADFSGVSNQLDAIQEKAFYTELYESNKGMIGFSECIVPYKQPDLYQDGLSKQVRSISYNTPSTNGVTTLGENYYYDLLYRAPFDHTVQDIILVDVLDRNQGTQWQGTFKSIDLSVIASRVSEVREDGTTNLCAPVAYYSSVIPTKAQMKNLSDPIWSTTVPATVAAVAIDCRTGNDGQPFVLPAQGNIYATVGMTAPEDETLLNKKALNILYAYSSVSPSEPLTAETEIILKPITIELHKHATYNKVQNDGEKDNPVIVTNLDNQTITYTLTVTNDSEKQTYYSTIVEDPIPEGLSVDTSKITVAVKNKAGTTILKNTAIESASGYSVEQSTEGKLDFTITQFAPGTVITFSIPAVQQKHVEEPKDYINTARITSINNHERIIEAETTYHHVDPATLIVTKTVAGNDGDTDKEFNFTVTLSKPYNTLTDIYGEMEFENGKATFTLKDGESRTAKGLPMDVKYTVASRNHLYRCRG